MDITKNQLIVSKSNQDKLVRAIISNTKELLQEVLDSALASLLTSTPNNIHLTETAINGYTPLTYCIVHKHFSLIPLLVSLGADINSRCPQSGIHPMVYTSLHSPPKALQQLIELGGIIDFEEEKEAQTTLITLAKNKMKKQFSLFLEVGENLSLEMVSPLFENPMEDADLSNYYMQHIIDYFIEKNDIMSVENIFYQYQDKLDLDILVGASVFTSSELAAEEILCFFLDKYFVFIETFHFEDALEIAVKHNFWRIVSILIKTTNLYSIDAKYEALLTATKEGYVKTLKTLLKEDDFEILAGDNAEEVYACLQENRGTDEFESMFNRFMEIEDFKDFFETLKKRIATLYDALSPDHLLSGPLNKSFFTQELEWITRYSLRHPTKCIFSIAKNNLYIYIEDTYINLSKLIKDAELGHISLDENDSALFPNLEVLLEKKSISELIHQPLPEDYLLSGEILTKAEKWVIHHYSDSAFTEINSVLYETPDEKIQKESDILNVFLNIVFLASGLNKIKPDWTKDPESTQLALKSFRGETHVTHEELTQRIEKLENNNIGIIQKQSGFTSTSSEKDVALDFEGSLSQIEYEEIYGKNIQPLARYSHEKEYLQLPCRIHFHQMNRNDKMIEFQAKVVTPLYTQYRSTQQEHRFKRLMTITNSSHLLSDSFRSIKLPLLEGLLKQCRYVYEHYLRHPFTENWFDVDWELVTVHGTINRPNHALAYVMRVAHIMPTLAEHLMYHDRSRFNFSDRTLCISMLMALFCVAGRKNESGFSDTQQGKIGHKEFKQVSAQAFADYVTKSQFLSMTEQEIALYSGYILRMGEPGENSPCAILLSLSRCLDLLRCFDEEQVEKNVTGALNQYLPTETTEKLVDYAEALLHATGNRVVVGKQPCDYDGDLFYMASTNIEFCYEALAKIEAPTVKPLTLPLVLSFKKSAIAR